VVPLRLEPVAQLYMSTRPRVRPQLRNYYIIQRVLTLVGNFLIPRMILRDDQWERIAPLLSGKAGDCGVTARDNR